MGQTDEGVKHPATRRSRLLVVRCMQCVRSSVSSPQFIRLYFFLMKMLNGDGYI